MLDLLALNLIGAFVIGGLWITLTTVIAEKFGSTIGGVIVGLPSTSVVAFLFIGLAQSPAAASQATTLFPIGYAFTALFLAAYVIFSKNRNFGSSIIGALGVWFVLSAGLDFSGITSFPIALIGCAVITFIAFKVLSSSVRAKEEMERINYSLPQLLIRGIFSGGMIAGAVLISSVGGPILGGIFSAFPAAYVSTLMIVNKSVGKEFSRMIARPIVTGGFLSVITYIVSIRYLYPAIGLTYGTALSFAIALVVAYLNYRLIKGK